MSASAKSAEEKSYTSEMQIGNTIFTVISVQGQCAKESIRSKLKKMILNEAQLSTKV